MASKVAILANLKRLADNMESLEDEDTPEEASESLPEEFRDDFVRLANNLEVNNIEFLAYWETNANCQNAVRQFIQPRLDVAEKMVGLIKELIA